MTILRNLAHLLLALVVSCSVFASPVPAAPPKSHPETDGQPAEQSAVIGYATDGGMLYAFDPDSGEWLATLNGSDGTPFAVDGLLAIVFGNGHSGGSAQTLYFTAGINGENDGLFGSLAAVNPGVTVGITYSQSNLVSDLPGVANHTDPNLVNPWGLTFSATSPIWVSDNGSGLSTLYMGNGVAVPLVVTIPGTGGVPGAPTGAVFNGGPDFKGDRFIFATEGGTIAGWQSGAGLPGRSSPPGL